MVKIYCSDANHLIQVFKNIICFNVKILVKISNLIKRCVGTNSFNDTTRYLFNPDENDSSQLFGDVLIQTEALVELNLIKI